MINATPNAQETQALSVAGMRLQRVLDERECVNFYRLLNTSSNASLSSSDYEFVATYSQGTAEHDGAAQLCRINSAIWNIAPLLFLLVGTLGNGISVFIWSSRRLAHQTQFMNVALVCLGVSDTLVLYTGFLRHYLRKASYIGWNLQNAGTLVCKTHEFLVYSGLSLSAWLVGFIAFERCVSIVFANPQLPHFPAGLCRCRCVSLHRPKSLYVSIGFLLVMCVGVNLHIFWTRVFSARECMYDRKTYPFFMDAVWPTVDLLFAAVIPVSIVVLSTISIAITLYCMKAKSLLAAAQTEQRDSQQEDKDKDKDKLHLRSMKPSVTSESSGVVSKPPKMRKGRSQSIVARKTSKITCTLICVSVCYILCTCPAKVYLVVNPTVVPPGVGPVVYFRYRLTWTSVLILQYLSNVINFLIYSMANSLFRKELVKLLRRLRCFAAKSPRTHKASAISAMSSVEFTTRP